MVLALLLCLAATVVTGLMAEQGEGKASPCKGAPPSSPRPSRMAQGGTSRARGDEKESTIGEAHAALANISLGLIVFHVLAVALASFVHRENLARAMITGEKRANEDAEDA